jgi:hypothetical protein
MRNPSQSLSILAGGLVLLASCGTTNVNQTLLENTITNSPTIAVKSDGQTLELGYRQVVEGNITLIRELTAFGETEDFPVTLAWTVPANEAEYFNFREGVLVVNPTAPIANQISVPVYNVGIIQPAFGTSAVDVSLNLLATMTVGTATLTTTRTYLLTIQPEAVDSSLIPLIPLSTDFTRNADGTYVSELLQNASRSVRNAPIIRARGYVTGIFTDWNTSYITSGEYGLALFRTDIGYIDAFAKGDFIEVTGEAATFNGSRQIAWMTNLRILPPTGDDVVVRQLSASNFTSVSVANSSQRFRDGSVVRLANLQFDQITSGSLPIGSANHLSLRFKVFDGNNSYNVNAYLNYRLGIPKREAIYALLLEAPLGGDKFLTYQGILGWSFGPQLMILEISDFVIQ